MLASLNHPHIGSIYGFEEDGGTDALVLELVDDQTLADRIAQDPLPLDGPWCGSTAAEPPQPVTDREAPFWWPRVSPDGRRVAVTIDGAFSKPWVLDIERGTYPRASQLAGDQDQSQ